jgi:hypothetical protein
MRRLVIVSYITNRQRCHINGSGVHSRCAIIIAAYYSLYITLPYACALLLLLGILSGLPGILQATGTQPFVFCSLCKCYQ